MNSAIHLYQSPLPVAAGRHSSASKAHASLSHGSLSVSQSFNRRSHLVSSPLHVNSRLHGFSDWSQPMNEEIGRKNNIVRGERGASPAMASVLGAFSLNGKMKHKPILACAGQGSNQTGGLVVDPLRALMMTTPPEDLSLTKEPNENQIEALKLYTMALSKDDPEHAADILRKVQQKHEDGATGGDLLMALVELLLYQEKYDEASERIKALGEVVKRDSSNTQTEGLSPFMPSKWRKFYLLKAIVESFIEARRSLKEARRILKEAKGELDTEKAKEAPWLIYCRQLEPEEGGFPRPQPTEKSKRP